MLSYPTLGCIDVPMKMIELPFTNITQHILTYLKPLTSSPDIASIILILKMVNNWYVLKINEKDTNIG